MGEIRKVAKVKLIIGMIAGSERLFTQAVKQLAKNYGPVDYSSKILPFNKTDYYQAEMGKGLLRQFISFAKLIRPENIRAIKHSTNQLEFKLSRNKNKRKINLDPGYLNYAKLVLATTKDHQHRLYLGRGIYGEVTLRYTNGTFTPWEWTYPDYATLEYIQIFNQIRKLYQQQLTKQ